MIHVGFYTVTIKETPNREPLKFLKRIGEGTIASIQQNIKYPLNGVLTAFTFSKEFSKELGHNVYVQNNDGLLDPYDPNKLPKK